jgi:hypothetical protein
MLFCPYTLGAPVWDFEFGSLEFVWILVLEIWDLKNRPNL